MVADGDDVSIRRNFAVAVEECSHRDREAPGKMNDVELPTFSNVDEKRRLGLVETAIQLEDVDFRWNLRRDLRAHVPVPP